MTRKLIIFTLAAIFLSGAAFASTITPIAVGQTSSTSGALKQSAPNLQQAVPDGGQVRMTPQQAAEYFTKLAGEGQAQAMYNLGTLYENGIGVPRNFSTALQWYLKAGEAGQAEGYHQAGLSYELGRGVAADRKTAIKYLEQAAEKKIPAAAYQLAALTLAPSQKEEDSAKALKYLKDLGLPNTQGMVVIGSLYESGQGLPQNYTKAFSWYKKAADAGSGEGFFRLGQCYEVGLGGAAEPKNAMNSFQKAADLKLGAADFKLAGIYAAGVLTPADNKKSLDHMNKALANGYSEAANELGVIYLEGLLGQPQNQDKAMEMFVKGADLGNFTAMKNIAVMYKNGVGRKADQIQALKWYLIAGTAGYQAEGFPQVVEGVKKDLKPEEIKKAEDEAKKWIEDFNAKNAAKK